MDMLLNLLDRHSTKATFFFVASLGRSFPAMVREVKARGHEIGSHSLEHFHPSTLTERQFFCDARDSKSILEDISSGPVESFRAPWLALHTLRYPALNILSDIGYLYDSSDSRLSTLEPWKLPVDKVFNLSHLPVTRLPLMNLSYPAGGGYLRILPQGMVWQAMQNLCRLNVPMTLYIHPYDINAKHPLLPKLYFQSLKRNIGRAGFLKRFDSILQCMDFTTIQSAVAYYENLMLLKLKGVED